MRSSPARSSLSSTHSLQQRPLFPSTVIALFTIHGGYDIVEKDGHSQVTQYIVPDGLEVTNILGAPPGVCYNTSAGILRDLARGLHELTIREETINEKLLKVIVETVTELESRGLQQDKDTLREQMRESIKQQDTSLVNPDLHLIVNKSELFLRPKNFKSGDKLLDKTFANDHDDKSNEDGYDLKINLVNMEGIPNLLDEERFPGLFRKRRRKSTEVTLGNSLTYLKNNGANRVVVIDLACSSFGNKISDRHARLLRRALMGIYFGGST
jgi:hypothetical protein